MKLEGESVIQFLNRRSEDEEGTGTLRWLAHQLASLISVSWNLLSPHAKLTSLLLLLVRLMKFSTKSTISGVGVSEREQREKLERKSGSLLSLFLSFSLFIDQ